MTRSNLFSLNDLDRLKPLEQDFFQSSCLTKDFLLKNSKNPHRGDDLARYIYSKTKDYIKSLLYYALSNHKYSSELSALISRHLKASRNLFETVCEFALDEMIKEKLVLLNLTLKHVDICFNGISNKLGYKVSNLLHYKSKDHELLRGFLFKDTNQGCPVENIRIGKLHLNPINILPFFNPITEILHRLGNELFIELISLSKTAFHLKNIMTILDCDDFLLTIYSAKRLLSLDSLPPFIDFLIIYRHTYDSTMATVFLSVAIQHLLLASYTKTIGSIAEELTCKDPHILLAFFEVLLLLLSMCPENVRVQATNCLRGSLSGISKNHMVLFNQLAYKHNLDISMNIRFLIYTMLTPSIILKSQRKRLEPRSNNVLYLELLDFKKSLLSTN